MTKKSGTGRGKSPTTKNPGRVAGGKKPIVTRTKEGNVDWGRFAKDNKRSPSAQLKTTAKPSPVKTATSKGINKLKATAGKNQTPSSGKVVKTKTPQKANTTGISKLKAATPKKTAPKAKAPVKKSPTKGR